VQGGGVCGLTRERKRETETNRRGGGGFRTSVITVTRLWAARLRKRLSISGRGKRRVSTPKR
jgi:hypothetical protein